MARIGESVVNGAVAAAAAAMLAGCQSFAPLPGGGISAMGSDSNLARSRLFIEPVPLPRPLRYVPVQRCAYRTVSTQLDAGQNQDERQELSIRPVRDRLLVTVSGMNASTALIGADGRLYDFNVTRSDGTQANAENFAGIAADRVRSLRAEGRSAEVLNDVQIAFPHYIEGRGKVGDVVAQVSDAAGRPWADYVYRGTTIYNGAQGAVFDLVRQSGGPVSLPLTVGFSIIDIQRGIPLFYVVDAGSEVRVERLSCD